MYTENEIKIFLESVDNFVNIIKKQERIIKDLESQVNRIEKIDFDRNGFRIVKTILKYISHGIEERRALFLAYDDFNGNVPFHTIEIIWKTARASKAGLILYGRAYCAKKMRLAGFTVEEIARTLGLSRTSVHKIIKNCCITD